MNAFRLLGLAAAAYSSPVLAADQFDLICDGWTTVQQPGGEAPFTVRQEYRIDLEAEEWCRDECSRTRPLESFGHEWITVIDRRGSATKPRERIYIDRLTGRLVEDYSDGQQSRRSELTCTVAPFRPFPQPLF